MESLNQPPPLHIRQSRLLLRPALVLWSFLFQEALPIYFSSLLEAPEHKHLLSAYHIPGVLSINYVLSFSPQPSIESLLHR